MHLYLPPCLRSVPEDDCARDALAKCMRMTAGPPAGGACGCVMQEMRVAAFDFDGLLTGMFDLRAFRQS